MLFSKLDGHAALCPPYAKLCFFWRKVFGFISPHQIIGDLMFGVGVVGIDFLFFFLE